MEIPVNRKSLQTLIDETLDAIKDSEPLDPKKAHKKNMRRFYFNRLKVDLKNLIKNLF